jgi:hypothetical protein
MLKPWYTETAEQSRGACCLRIVTGGVRTVGSVSYNYVEFDNVFY